MNNLEGDVLHTLNFYAEKTVKDINAALKKFSHRKTIAKLLEDACGLFLLFLFFFLNLLYISLFSLFFYNIIGALKECKDLPACNESQESNPVVVKLVEAMESVCNTKNPEAVSLAIDMFHRLISFGFIDGYLPVNPASLLILLFTLLFL